MRVLFVLPLLLLAAAANAALFEIARPQPGSSAVYQVQGAVTVGVPKETSQKAALQYSGELAVQKIRGSPSAGVQTYVAQFKSFDVEKTSKYEGYISEIFDSSSSESSEENEDDDAQYLRQMQKPVVFTVQEGEVQEHKAQRDQPQWALNIYRAILTLFQGKADAPSSADDFPSIQNEYQDGIAGNCRVRYEILSQPEDEEDAGKVLNVTLVKYYNDCKEPRPVYRHNSAEQRGCPEVCYKHRPENFIPGYEADQNDYEQEPSTGCPVGRKPTDTLVTIHKQANYNISNGQLDEAEAEHFSVYRSYDNKVVVRSVLRLERDPSSRAQPQQPQSPTKSYSSLQMQLPKTSEELDIPTYSLQMPQEPEDNVPKFKRHLDAAVQDIVDLEQEDTDDQPNDAAYYTLQMVNAIASMSKDDIKRTTPPSIQKNPEQISPREQIYRSLWLECLGKAGSKAAVEVAIDLLKKQGQSQLTPNEKRILLQNIAAYIAYPDKEIMEKLLDVCLMDERAMAQPTKAAACIAAGKAISKGCLSAVRFPPYTKKQHQQQSQHQHKPSSLKSKQSESDESSSEEDEDELMARLALDEKDRCTVEDLNEFIESVSSALQKSDSQKEILAYINALAHIAKPEVLPELLPYLNGTADNWGEEQDEDEEEERDFVRQFTVLALHKVAAKFPKAVSPIPFSMYLNTSESNELRTLALDLWLQCSPSAPAINQAITQHNNEESVEVGSYFYSSLKALFDSKEPCKQQLVKRIQRAWSRVRPFPLGQHTSHRIQASHYEPTKDYGIGAFWKVVANSNSSYPAFAGVGVKHNRGPYQKKLFRLQALMKGVEPLWDEIIGEDGFLDRIADALDGHLNLSPRKQPREQKPNKDIAHELNIEEREDESPKVAAFFKVLGGEGLAVIDEEAIQQLRNQIAKALYQASTKGITAHIVRVLMPTNEHHVGPTPVGIPVSYSTQQPIIFSLKLENFKINFDNQVDSIVPEKLEISGKIQPSVLSVSQTRVWAADLEGEKSPTVTVTRVHEATLSAEVKVKYSDDDNKLQVKVKPQQDRILHHIHCIEISQDENDIIDENPDDDWMQPEECVQQLAVPFEQEREYGEKVLGMSIRINKTSHSAWEELPFFASQVHQQHGLIPAFIRWISNADGKHRIVSAYLEPEDVDEWVVTLQTQDNSEELAEQSQHQLKQHQQQQNKKQQQKFSWASSSEEDEDSGSESSEEDQDQSLEQICKRAEQLVETIQEESEDSDESSSSEEQPEEPQKQHYFAVVAEGRRNGQVQRRYQACLKNSHTFDRTERYLGLVAEAQQPFNKKIEIRANVTFPDIDNPFAFVPEYLDGDNANSTIIANIFHGNSRRQEEYVIRVNATKTEEQRYGVINERGRRVAPSFFAQCLVDQRQGNTASHACLKANVRDNSLDNIQITVELPDQVHPQLKHLAKKALDAIVYAHFPKVQSELNDEEDTDDSLLNITLKAGHFKRHPHWDLEIETPQKTVTANETHIPFLRAPNMFHTLEEQVEYVMRRGYYPSCGLGKHAIVTFDNNTHPLYVRPECKYLLARDCTSSPDFTVVYEPVDFRVRSKKLTVQIADAVFEIPPPELSEAKVTITCNGTEYELDDNSPRVLEVDADTMVHIDVRTTQGPHDPPVVALETDDGMIKLYFDGFSAQLEVDPSYQGDMCGLCGNYNGESDDDMIGPDQEEMEDAEEFIASYGMGGSQCQTPVQPPRQQKQQWEAYFHQQEERQQQQQLQQPQQPWNQQQPSRRSQQQHQQQRRHHQQYRHQQESSEEQQYQPWEQQSWNQQQQQNNWQHQPQQSSWYQQQHQQQHQQSRSRHQQQQPKRHQYHQSQEEASQEEQQYQQPEQHQQQSRRQQQKQQPQQHTKWQQSSEEESEEQQKYSRKQQKHQSQHSRWSQQGQESQEESHIQSEEDNENLPPECVKHRNIIRHKDNSICVSRRPVLTCASNCLKDKGNKREKISFACFPKDSQQAKKMIREIKESDVVPEASVAPISHFELVRIPEKCSPAHP